MLSEYFLSRYSAESGMDNPGMTKEAKSLLDSYSWHGNVRELANVIRKTLIFNRGAPLCNDDILHAISEKNHLDSENDKDDDTALRQMIRRSLSLYPHENKFDACMDRFAEILISEALSMTGGNRSKASKLLGLSRPTLHSKIEKYRLKTEISVKR
ncbi:MAG: hypothetical protein HC887_13360 [Desulfobacteraceae bacterium]|nr:hypothetical protein [Desulfobacteraceae bacterium]